MNLMFFQLSDYPLKVRRNLLLMAVLTYLHINVQSLSDIKVFSVAIPQALISSGLLIALVWFSCNYFYYLYAEFIEWKAKHISRANTSNFRVANTTLVSEISELADNTYTVSLKFDHQISKNLFDRGDEREIDKAWGKQAEVLARKVLSQIKSDLDLIKEFQGAMWRYKTAHRVRFWILDIAIPVVATILGIFWLGISS